MEANNENRLSFSENIFLPSDSICKKRIKSTRENLEEKKKNYIENTFISMIKLEDEVDVSGTTRSLFYGRNNEGVME